MRIALAGAGAFGEKHLDGLKLIDNTIKWLTGDKKGKVVMSPSAAGEGDLLLSAGGRELRSPADLEAAVRAAQTANRTAVLVRIQRGPQPAGYVPLRIR